MTKACPPLLGPSMLSNPPDYMYACWTPQVPGTARREYYDCWIHCGKLSERVELVAWGRATCFRISRLLLQSRWSIYVSFIWSLIYCMIWASLRSPSANPVSFLPLQLLHRSLDPFLSRVSGSWYQLSHSLFPCCLPCRIGPVTPAVLLARSTDEEGFSQRVDRTGGKWLCFDPHRWRWTMLMMHSHLHNSPEPFHHLSRLTLAERHKRHFKIMVWCWWCFDYALSKVLLIMKFVQDSVQAWVWLVSLTRLLSLFAYCN